jgi:hypothetical protein
LDSDEKRFRDEMDEALGELALVEIDPNAHKALDKSKHMSLKDLKAMIQGKEAPKQKATLPNSLKPRSRKTMSKTDKHDFNYKVTKEGVISEPADVYGLKKTP